MPFLPILLPLSVLFTALYDAEGVTMVFKLIVEGIFALFLYFQIGYLFTKLQMWSWHTNGRKNKILAALLFPWTTSYEYRRKTPTPWGDSPQVVFIALDDENDIRRRLPLLTVLWPIWFAWNLFMLTIICPLLMTVHLFLSQNAPLGAILKFFWFIMAEAPTALATDLWTRLRTTSAPGVPAKLTGVRVETTDELPVPDLSSVEGRNATRLKEYRELCAKKLVLGNDITQVEERITTLEAEDDADNAGDAYRDAANQLRYRAEAT